MNAQNIHYLVLDIETSGLLCGDNVIIQIAYNGYDKFHQKLTEVNRVIQNTLGYTDYYRKFTSEYIQEHGVARIDALNELAHYLKKSAFIVGHNIKSFDVPYLAKEFTDLCIPIQFPHIIDTMQCSKLYCGLLTRTRRPKWPSLDELCHKCLKKDMNKLDAHTAQYDVEITAQCFHKLLELNVISAEHCSSPPPKHNQTQITHFIPNDRPENRKPEWTKRKSKEISMSNSGIHKYPEVLKKVCKESPIQCSPELSSVFHLSKNTHGSSPTRANTLPPISAEQQAVVHALSENNVVVNSVAGSGKTTCILYIALQNPDKRILALTYSSRLRHETKEKASLLGIRNIEVHTFHSFCYKYYKSGCYTDSGIRSILLEKTYPIQVFRYDIIIPDETQDMTPLLYEILCKIAKDNLHLRAKICLFGDENQTIYQFKEASHTFIQKADELFKFNLFPWVKSTLSQSFRITSEMADFVNYCILHNPRITSVKTTGHKPRYVLCDTFNGKETLTEIKYYIQTLGYHPSDIFILASSVKSHEKKAVTLLENEIKRQLPNVSVFVPSGDECKTTTDLLKNKIAFLSFHQAKGLERKVVIVMDFDDNFFWNKTCDTGICPNEIYVACTRGVDHLSVLHNHSKPGFSFLSWDHVDTYCDVVNPFGTPQITALRRISVPKIRPTIGVTNLLQFIPCDILTQCRNMLSIQQINPIAQSIGIHSTIHWTDRTTGKTYTENVSDINGTAIPTAYEYFLNTHISIYDGLKTANFDHKYQHLLSSNETAARLFREPVECIAGPASFLSLAACWLTHNDGLYNRLMQIRTFDWMSDNQFDQCVQRMNTSLTIDPTSVFEPMLESIIRPEGLPSVTLVGRMDCVDFKNTTVYEFKCVQTLEDEHFVQLAIYMYLFYSNPDDYDITPDGSDMNPSDFKFRLYNILTDEMYEIKCSLERVTELVELLWTHSISVDMTHDPIYRKSQSIYDSHWASEWLG